MNEQRRDRKGRYATGPVKVPTASDTSSVSMPTPTNTRIRASVQSYATVYDRVKHLINPDPTHVPTGPLPLRVLPDTDGVPARPAQWTPDKLSAMFNEGNWEGTTFVELDGTRVQEWRNAFSGAVVTMTNDKLDSRNGNPAVITPDGSRMWYHEGMLHGNPAVILPDGTRITYEYGVRREVTHPQGVVTHVPVSPVNRLVLWMLRDHKR